MSRTIETELQFLVLAANTPWVYSLSEALAERDAVFCTRMYDWLNYRRLRPAWPSRISPAKLKRTMRIFPPGYAGALEAVARPFMRQLIARWRKGAGVGAGRNPFVICPYPYLVPWLRDVPDEAYLLQFG